MTKVFLHAGPARTGTTAVQTWLSRNAGELLKHGVFTFANTDFAHQFAIDAISDPETRARPDIPTFPVPLGAAENELRRAVDDEMITRIVLSSECFSVADPSLVQQRLAELSLTDITAIMVLRRQDRAIESGYSQVIRYNGWTAPIGAPRYVKDFDWYLLASSWSQVIGQQNVFLHLYENISGERSIVSQLFHGVDAFLVELLAKEGGSVDVTNQSLPAALIEFNRLANLAGASNILEFLDTASQRGIGGPPFRMRCDDAKRFLDCYRPSNRKVALEFFQREGDLFDEGDLECDTRGADYTNCLPVETLAMLFALYMEQLSAKS